MAKATAEAGGPAIVPPAGKKKAVESKYPSTELAKAAGTDSSLFGAGVTPDIVTAAFFVTGKYEATKQEAKEIVREFLKGGRK